MSQFQPKSTVPTDPKALMNLVWGSGGTPTPDSGLTDAPIDFGSFATSGANA